MKIGKRSLALLLGSILLLSTLIPCTMFFSAAAEEPVSVYASDLQRLITKAETGWSGYPVTYDKDPGGGSVGHCRRRQRRHVRKRDHRPRSRAV